MKIRGFTPVIDSIRDDVGITSATVYGVMWRYAQQHALRICTAKQKKIAERAGLTRETIARHQKVLEEAGYIREAGRFKGGVISWACLVDISGEVYMGVGEWDDVEESDNPPAKKSDTKKKETTKKDMLDFVAENSKDVGFDVTWIPADVLERLTVFGAWFTRIYDRQPTKSERGYWIRVARQWIEAGYKAEQVQQAIDYCMEAGTTIKSPASITWAFDQLGMVEESESFSREM